MTNKFKNLADIQRVFNTEEKCRQHLEEIRWNGNPVCPHCGTAEKPYKLKDGKTYKCSDKDCKQKFTVTVGTIFENTKLPLQKWFIAMYLVTSHKKGISSLQLSRDLGIGQKAAWFVNHRIREMLREEFPAMLNGMVEADETYVGGKVKNKHAHVRRDIKNKMSPLIKTPVLGLLERDGKVFTQVVKDVNRETVLPIVRGQISSTAMLVTDSSHMYTPINETHEHHVINHTDGEYVRGFVHTNGIEGYWSLLKRGIIGIYHYVSPKHLSRYCDEFSYRYNTRKQGESERFCNAITGASGKRLKYKNLIAKNVSL